MKPSKSFLLVLAGIAVAGFVIIATPRAAPVHAQDSMPMSTKLTPAMIDFFALDVAYERPSIAALVSCKTVPACGASDSSQVRFLNVEGHEVAAYTATPSTTIEQVRRLHLTPIDGVTEDRTRVRRVSTDTQGRIVLQGSDSIVKRSRATANAAESIVTRVHHYSDVRYLVNDLTYIWPITGLVTLELSDREGAVSRAATPLVAHAAVSYDGTPYAHILTSGAVTHRVNLRAKLLETTMPAR